MKPIIAASLLSVLPLLNWPSSVAADSSQDPGAQLYRTCVACHGAESQGNRAMNAPRLAGQLPWYLERQLKAFRSGARGNHPDDTWGGLMRANAGALPDDEAVAIVAAYIGTFPQPDNMPARTVDGDPERGKGLFRTCQACHGAEGQGNTAMNAPRLRGQHDWYLVRQLDNFRQRVRGGAGDRYGAVMAPMADALPGDQAIADVVSHINSL